MHRTLAVTAGALLLALGGSTRHATWAAEAATDWHMNATVIEACSCPMFCQCYFNTKPAGHAGHGGGEHFCRFNNAYKVNKGHHGATRLDGAKFWISGDLGAEFEDGEMDWAVLTFDKSLSQAQRDGIAAIAGHIFPVRWKSFEVREGVIDKWEFSKDEAHALLDGGKTAEVKLQKPPTAMTPGPAVLTNIRYWGVPRHDGFVMMPNVVEAYRVAPKAFEYKGTNGFMLTLDISSKDVEATKRAAAH